MADTHEAFVAGFWQGAYEFGAGGDEVSDAEIDEMYTRWVMLEVARLAAGATDA